MVGEIVHAVSSAIKKPLTVKIRKGFTESTTNAVEIAKIAEANGAAAVAVHGRTREQYYSGEADWKIIKAVKEAVSIPVIGNGDVITPESAAALINVTGCDAVMIARGARGNPWIFSQIKEYYQTGKMPKKPTPQEAVNMMLRHARMSIDYKGEYTGIREMRKHIAWYTTGYPLAAKLRNRVNEIESIEQLQELLFEYLKSIG